MPSPGMAPWGSAIPILRRVRRLVILAVAGLVALLVAPAGAQEGSGRVDVVVLEGAIDAPTAEFVTDAIVGAAADSAQAVILQVDATGSVAGDAEALEALVGAPPVPVVVWVGDAPARATGTAARLVEAAAVATAAPGVEVGWSEYVTVGGDPDPDHAGDFVGAPESVVVDDGRFDTVQAAVGQVVVWLDGVEVAYGAGSSRVLETAEEVVDDDGAVRLQQSVTVRFVERSVWAGLLNAALQPATLVFLLAAGLTVAAFEFYALGPGVAAATALLPLLVAAYGLAHLPLAWWAALLVLAGLLLMVIDYQAGAFGPWSVGGAILLAVGGRFLVAGAPLLEASWLSSALTAVATALFFAVAMPVVARSRFSTGTFGRSHLVGSRGSVVEAFADGAGVVEVEGARWKASAHRESRLPAGAPVEVTAVRGLWLEVDEPQSTDG